MTAWRPFTDDIYRQSLGSEETQVMVGAMQSHVEEEILFGALTLDFRILRKYNGKGKCRKASCISMNRYRDQLRTWAKSRNWTVTDDFVIERI